MSDAKKKGLALRPLLPAVLVVLGWLGVRVIRSRTWDRGYEFVEKVIFRALGGFPAAQDIAAHAFPVAVVQFIAAYGFVLAWGTLLVPLGFIARMIARSRIRAGGTDPFERFRRWTQRHTWGTRAVVAVPAGLWAAFGLYVLYENFKYGTMNEVPVLAFLTPAVAAVTGIYAATRFGLRALLAPTLDVNEDAPIEIKPDEIVFDAVAVTRETRAAVGGLAALSVAMVVWMASLPILTLFRDPRLFSAVAGYVVVALGGAFVFRRASRVAVGVDGVRVAGTSRTRFFAYRDLDDVRVTGGDLELLRRGNVVVRLQLHGADAVRREAVCARIRENIAHVKGGKDAVAAQLVASASKEQLARVASGGADYRAASLSREALWALIEGPAVEASSRKAAAEALARTNDDGERTRLRVAAERCADPQVRVALEQLADAGPEEPHAEDAKRRATSTLA